MFVPRLKPVVMMVILCMLCVPSQASDDVPVEFFDSVMEQLWNNNTPAAITLLDEIIQLYPDSAKAYKMRAQLYYIQGKGEAALDDIRQAAGLDPSDNESLLARCTLQESMGTPKSSLLPCYTDAVKIMRERHSSQFLKTDQFYVIAVLLAELPEAEAVKQEYLDAPDSFGSESKDYVRNFHRSSLKKQYEALKEGAENQ